MFEALRQLRGQPHTRLGAWLLARKPASNTNLLIEALGGDEGNAGDSAVPPTANGSESGASGSASASGNAASQGGSGQPTPPASPVIQSPIEIGTTANHQTIRLELETLRKHVCLFAGSGSGKTVLIRRLVEECALRGVSSIVLDPGNDLARLGDSWPEEPTEWVEGDTNHANEYLENTDVLVWTPRQPAGRPLAFQPLPDFTAVQDDEYETQQAIDAAVETLAPRAKMDGNTAKAQHGRAVLHEAMTYFARKGYSGLHSFVALLGDLPDGVTGLPDASKMAAEMAKTLASAMVLDKLFGGAGTPVDPGILLTPSQGKRARISVISFIGLVGDEQKQSFVNQLQLGLFTWIKKNPARDRPLGGLLVMDEAQTFAPSDRTTTATSSTLVLVTQARKYGLGLVFGTQAPKGLHNHIPSNAATQFFGRLGAGAPVDAAKVIAQSKASGAKDFADLGPGTFYISTEETPFVKIRTPLCLSYHPKSALTPEEVTARARAEA